MATTTNTSTTTTTTTPSVPVDERTPAQKQVDQHAAAIGYTVGYGYQYAHEVVVDACNTMTSNTAGLPGGVWLARNVSGSPKLVDLYRAGFPLVCGPEHVAILDALLTGAAPIAGGTYEVGAELGKVKPGQWRNVDAVDECYWERTSPSGQILDNDFVTHAVAHSITITIHAGDGSFTSRGCGYWERQG